MWEIKKKTASIRPRIEPNIFGLQIAHSSDWAIESQIKSSYFILIDWLYTRYIFIFTRNFKFHLSRIKKFNLVLLTFHSKKDKKNDVFFINTGSDQNTLHYQSRKNTLIYRSSRCTLKKKNSIGGSQFDKIKKYCILQALRNNRLFSISSLSSPTFRDEKKREVSKYSNAVVA